MRFFVAAALATLATPALACGMYIPDDMLIAGIGELMDDVDGEAGTVVTQEVEEPAAENAALLAAVTADAEPVTQAARPVVVPEVSLEAPRKLTRKERRKLKRQARSAGV